MRRSKHPKLAGFLSVFIPLAILGFNQEISKQQQPVKHIKQTRQPAINMHIANSSSTLQQPKPKLKILTPNETSHADIKSTPPQKPHHMLTWQEETKAQRRMLKTSKRRYHNLNPWQYSGNMPILEPLHQHHTLYYQIKTPKTDPYYRTWQSALYHWNQLKVIKFKPLPNHAKFKPDVILNGTYDYQLKHKYNTLLKKPNVTIEIPKEKLGYTSMPYFVNFAKRTARYQQKTATLTSYTTLEPKALQIATAEHELGHVLGFEHDNRLTHHKKHIMNAIEVNHIKSLIPLGKLEQATLKHYYH